jgi:hypothetical protein
LLRKPKKKAEELILMMIKQKTSATTISMATITKEDIVQI